MRHHKGVIARPETEIYYYLRGEKQARRRQGEKATLSSVLLEYVKEGIKLHKQGHTVFEGYLIENKIPQRSDLHPNPYPESTTINEDKAYNIIEWIDDLERLKYPRSEKVYRDQENSSAQELLLTEDGKEKANNIPGNPVQEVLEHDLKQVIQEEKAPDEKIDAKQEEPVYYVPKTPIGNRMPDCTTIQHKMAAFQIETTTQQQRLIWIIRDCGVPLSDFLAKTRITAQELLDVFLTNVDSVNDSIISSACSGFKQYNLQWIKEGSEYSPYNDILSSKNNITECAELPGQTNTVSGKKEKAHCPLKDFDISILYSNYRQEEPKAKQAIESKESNNLLGGLVQGLLNHKQQNADLQRAMLEDDEPFSFEDNENEGGKERESSANEQKILDLVPEKNAQSPLDGIMEKYKPVLDGFIELAKPFIEPFIKDLINTCIVQYPSMAEPIEKMITQYQELVAIKNESPDRVIQEKSDYLLEQKVPTEHNN